MKPSLNSHTQWYEAIVQPKLGHLALLATSEIVWSESEIKEFFRHFLADLELMGLDNYTVEHYIDKIQDGYLAQQKHLSALKREDLKDLAVIALMPNSWDRRLFLTYWTQYLPLLKQHKQLKETSIINAYRLPLHVQMLTSYIFRHMGLSILDNDPSTNPMTEAAS